MEFVVTLSAEQYASLMTGLTAAQVWAGKDNESSRKWDELTDYIVDNAEIKTNLF